MDVEFTEADDARWEEYDALARRAYGQPVPDITCLGPHADRRVAVRGGRVVAGGMGMLVPQWFGGLAGARRRYRAQLQAVRRFAPTEPLTPPSPL